MFRRRVHMCETECNQNCMSVVKNTKNRKSVRFMDIFKDKPHVHVKRVRRLLQMSHEPI